MKIKANQIKTKYIYKDVPTPLGHFTRGTLGAGAALFSVGAPVAATNPLIAEVALISSLTGVIALELGLFGGLKDTTKKKFKRLPKKDRESILNFFKKKDKNLFKRFKTELRKDTSAISKKLHKII